MFTIKPVQFCVVSAEHMTRAVDCEVRAVDYKVFFSCSKTVTLARILCGDRTGAPKRNALTGVSVFGVIASLRDDATRKAIGATKGRAWTTAQKAKALLIEDCPCTVTTPTIANVDGRTINVLHDKCASPAWVELENDTLTYLAQVVRAERDLDLNLETRNVLDLNLVKGSGIHHLKSGRMNGYVRVRRAAGELSDSDDGGDGVTDTPMKERKKRRTYHYMKINEVDPTQTIVEALNWRNGCDGVRDSDDQLDDETAQCDNGETTQGQ